jgi:RNA polymerase sigma-70 factor, ECF subfamily
LILVSLREIAICSDPDDLLVQRWVSRHAASFDTLVERHGPPLHGFLRMLLSDPAAAEDAWGETWIRVVRARERYNPEDRFRAWLFTIGRRCARDQARSGRRRLNLAMSWKERSNQPVAPSPALRLVRKREARTLDLAIASLKEEHRVVLLLTYRYDLSSGEVGVVMGLTGQQVRSRLTYARKLLKDELENRGVGNDR